MIRFVASALVLVMGAGVNAQDKPAPKQTPLKIQLVLSRSLGGKKLSNLPDTMWVTATEPGRNEVTRLRLGVQIPVVSTVFGASSDKDKTASVPQMSYSYKDVGTNIDCYAHVMSDGTYRVF